MIQRKQTLYFLATAILIALMIWMPLGRFFSGNFEFTLTAFGIRDVGAADQYQALTLYMGILAVLASLLPFVTIFLYRNRLLQIRLCFAEMVLLIGLQVFVGYYLYKFNGVVKMFDPHSMTFALADVFPLIGVILMWLGFQGVAADEALVRSQDRIR